MNHDELISAYLDDELAPDQRDEVERLLASDAGARRLRDELRAQRDALSKLPRLSLGEDLTGAVLRAAERRMLLDTPMPATAASRDTPDWLRRARRPAAWAALVLAAGLLIMLLAPRRETPEVAVAPAAPEDSLDASAVRRERVESMRAADESAEREPTRAAESLGVPAEPAGDAPAASRALGKGGAPSGGFGKGGFGGAGDSRQRADSMPAAPQSAQPPAQTLEAQTAEAQSLAFDVEPLPGGTLFICDASPDAAASNAFARVLTNNFVRVENGPAQLQQQAAIAGRGPQAAESAPPAGQSDTWLVETTPEQMQNIVDELAEQPQQFNVFVAPLSQVGGAAQQGLAAPQQYTPQFRARAMRAQNQARQGYTNQSNARLLNRLTTGQSGGVNVEQAPGGAVNGDAAKKEQAQAATDRLRSDGRDTDSTAELAEAEGENLRPYVVIVRQAAGAPSHGQAAPAQAPASQPASPSQPP